jgi:hypothetical protein
LWFLCCALGSPIASCKSFFGSLLLLNEIHVRPCLDPKSFWILTLSDFYFNLTNIIQS